MAAPPSLQQTGDHNFSQLYFQNLSVYWARNTLQLLHTTLVLMDWLSVFHRQLKASLTAGTDNRSWLDSNVGP